MQLYTPESARFTLPEQVLPLIQGYASDEDKFETLKSLATRYMRSREKPTRIAFNSVSETLAVAREQGFADPEINSFLAELEIYLREH